VAVVTSFPRLPTRCLPLLKEVSPLALIWTEVPGTGPEHCVEVALAPNDELAGFVTQTYSVDSLVQDVLLGQSSDIRPVNGVPMQIQTP
jgi:hypothetical protein